MQKLLLANILSGYSIQGGNRDIKIYKIQCINKISPFTSTADMNQFTFYLPECDIASMVTIFWWLPYQLQTCPVSI